MNEREADFGFVKTKADILLRKSILKTRIAKVQFFKNFEILHDNESKSLGQCPAERYMCQCCFF